MNLVQPLAGDESGERMLETNSEGSPTGPKTMLVKAAASITVARPLYMRQPHCPQWMVASPLPQGAREEPCAGRAKEEMSVHVQAHWGPAKMGEERPRRRGGPVTQRASWIEASRFTSVGRVPPSRPSCAFPLSLSPPAVSLAPPHTRHNTSTSRVP